MRDGIVLNRYFMVTQFAENGSLDTHICKDYAAVPLDQRQVCVRVCVRVCVVCAFA